MSFCGFQEQSGGRGEELLMNRQTGVTSYDPPVPIPWTEERLAEIRPGPWQHNDLLRGGCTALSGFSSDENYLADIIFVCASIALPAQTVRHPSFAPPNMGNTGSIIF